MLDIDTQDAPPVTPPSPGSEVPLAPFPVHLTPHACDEVRKALAAENLQGHALRVGVMGGGCSGMEVQLDFAEAALNDDWVQEQHGLKVVVDPHSATFLVGTQVDHIESLDESGFKIDNPNIVKQCGCGKSFQV
jgi:iron-sulfur cluster assembly accessory protein